MERNQSPVLLQSQVGQFIVRVCAWGGGGVSVHVLVYSTFMYMYSIV